MQKILLNDTYGLTQAVLNCRKTMTRRVIKDVNMIQALNKLEDDNKIYRPNADIEIIKEKVARYKLGEIVALAQAYKDVLDELPDRFRELVIGYYSDTKAWGNKLFVRADLMPHQIQITDMKIERLQDIPDEDCWKEGIIIKTIGDFGTYAGYGYGERRASSLDETFSTPRKAFASLINRPGVGRKGLWESNPFVVVYEFKLVK